MNNREDKLNELLDLFKYLLDAVFGIFRVGIRVNDMVKNKGESNEDDSSGSDS